MLPPEFGALSSYKETRDHAWRQDENSSMHFTSQAERSADQSSQPSGGYPVDDQSYYDDTSLMKFAIGLSLGLEVPSSSCTSTFQYEMLLAKVASVDVSEHQIELPFSSLDWCSRGSEESGSALEIENANAGAFEQPDALPLIFADDSQFTQNDHSPSALASMSIASEQLKQSMSNEPIKPITSMVAGIDRRLIIRPEPAEGDPVEVGGKDLFVNSGNLSRTNSVGIKFTCDICDKSFPNSNNLARHKKIHSSKKKFGCEICHKSFLEKYVFARHMTIHTNQKKFTCDFCDKTFTRSGSLARHMTTRHTGGKTFACRVCDKKFARKDALKSHMRTHPVEKNLLAGQGSITARTALMEFGEQQQTRIDASSVYLAYPTLVPSAGVILVKVNIADVFEGTR